MAIGEAFNPKTLKQLAEDAVVALRTRQIGSVTSQLTKVKVQGEEVYKCSVQMKVIVAKKDSQVAQRQINDIHRRVKELNDKYESMNIKLNLEKSAIRKKWSYKRFKHKKRLDFYCQFTFMVTNKDIITLRDTSQRILEHIEDLMIIYYEDEYKIKYNRGSRTESGSSDDTVEISNNPNGPKSETEKPENSTEPLTEPDNGLKVQTHDPQYHIRNETGTIHLEDKSKKNHYHIFNCFNTGRKDGKGCFSGLFSIFKACIPCIKKT